MSQVVVTAFCTRPWCHVKEFTMLRESTEYKNGEGDTVPIKHVRCPRCRAMAPIVKQQEIA